MANTTGEKELKRDWPVVSGIDADSKHEGRKPNLIPEGKNGLKTTVLQRDKIGL